MSKILIIDDDVDLVDNLQAVLEANGHGVSSVHTRHDGMVAVDTVKPDLIIMDVMMEEPDDGFTLAGDLRRAGHTTPILMLTSVSKALGMDFEKDNDLVPVDAFEEKPIKPNRLIAKVNELLNRG